jgi:hypothetical protein
VSLPQGADPPPPPAPRRKVEIISTSKIPPSSPPNLRYDSRKYAKERRGVVAPPRGIRKLVKDILFLSFYY